MRLIDADALYRDIKKNVGAYYPEHEDIKDECLCEVNEAPTVDAVEVVRCGECKHYGTSGCAMDAFSFDVTEESFCSYGERRGNNDKGRI